MKERPIIMTGESVRGILADRKTQTRRVVKPQPEFDECSIMMRWKNFSLNGRDITEHCPYGKVGDRLWVKENFIYGGGIYDGRTRNIRYVVDNVEIKYKIPDDFSWDKTCKWCYTKLDGTHPIRPSIFMPRWASRILLEITGVRVERLQEISREDIRAEGGGLPVSPQFTPGKQYKESELHQEFASLWDSLNAKRGYGWEVNPWVWVISFRRVE